MKPKYFNVFNGVIDKYSDSAHFIYEMLQNADDAGATEVEMELLPDKFKDISSNAFCGVMLSWLKGSTNTVFPYFL